MKFKVQVVTLLDDGEESLREVACVERDDLSAVSLGLSIADSKAILQGMQEVVVAVANERVPRHPTPLSTVRQATSPQRVTPRRVSYRLW